MLAWLAMHATLFLAAFQMHKPFVMLTKNVSVTGKTYLFPADRTFRHKGN